MEIEIRRTVSKVMLRVLMELVSGSSALKNNVSESIELTDDRYQRSVAELEDSRVSEKLIEVPSLKSPLVAAPRFTATMVEDGSVFEVSKRCSSPVVIVLVEL